MLLTFWQLKFPPSHPNTRPVIKCLMRQMADRVTLTPEDDHLHQIVALYSKESPQISSMCPFSTIVSGNITTLLPQKRSQLSLNLPSQITSMPISRGNPRCHTSRQTITVQNVFSNDPTCTRPEWELRGTTNLHLDRQPNDHQLTESEPRTRSK